MFSHVYDKCISVRILQLVWLVVTPPSIQVDLVGIIMHVIVFIHCLSLLLKESVLITPMLHWYQFLGSFIYIKLAFRLVIIFRTQ